MEYRVLGRTGLQVSVLCFGAMTLGGKGDRWQEIGSSTEGAARSFVDAAVDAGVNFFDVANDYHEGESESFLGKALAGKRDRVIINTKVGFPVGPQSGVNDRGLSRASIVSNAEASLRRLGTDYIDLYTIHRRDPRTPIDETLRALDDLVTAGKVRYIGVSNWPAWQVAQALGVSALHDWARFECMQANYSLAVRDIEREILPMCHDQQVSLTAWGALAAGTLTGKYRGAAEPPPDSRRARTSFGQPANPELTERVLDVSVGVAERLGTTPGAVALAWLQAQPGVTSVIFGASTVEQLQSNVASVELTLSEQDLDELSQASALAPEYPAEFNRWTDHL